MNQQNKFFPLLLAFLYFSQGLPSGLLAHTLPAIMRQYTHVDLGTIGLLKLLALPWFFKFLWAPFIDQYWSRKYWIISFQSIAIALLVALSFINPATLFSSHIHWLFLGLFLLNLVCASQDIATDGIAVSGSEEKQLGITNSIQVGAYKIGLIAGGALMLLFFYQIGWQWCLLSFAILLTIALLPVFAFRHTTLEPSKIQTPIPIKTVALEFLNQPNIKLWFFIIISYKMADALGSSMIKPLLVDCGFTLAEIGSLTIASSLVGIGGAIIGGLLLRRFSLKSCLISFGILQAIAIGSYALVTSELPQHWVYAIALVEQFSDGLSTVALFAGMMMHCRTGLEGTDYTLQNSLLLMGSGLLALTSGFIAQFLGYHTLYLIALTLGLASVFLISKCSLITFQNTTKL